MSPQETTMKLPGPPSRVRSRIPEEISSAASASFNYAPALSAYEYQLSKCGGRFIIFKLGNGFFLVAVLERHTRRRITERESFLQQPEIVGNAGPQARVVKKIRRKLRLGRGHYNQPGVAPIELGHAFTRVQAVCALRVEEENENAALLCGERFPVHGDGGWRLSAVQFHRRCAIGNHSEYRYRARHDDGAALALSRPCPKTCQHREQQHDGIAHEKSGSHSAFDPRKTIALRPVQGGVVGADVNHERNQKRRAQ